MNQFKSFFKELFTEADNFQARSKETGKLVNFKSKASMDAALKAGSHENPTAPKGGKVSGKAKSGVNIFDKPKADTSKAPAMKQTKVKPDSEEVQTIAKLTGVREKFIADYINKHKLDAAALANFAKTGPLQDRLSVGRAMVGDPGNKFEKELIKKFGAGKSQSTATSLPKKASQLSDKHANLVADTLNKETGLDGHTEIDDNTGTIRFTSSPGNEPTYTLTIGSNQENGKPNQFRVSFKPTVKGKDPGGFRDNIDKSFETAEEAMAFAVKVAKKYKSELELDSHIKYRQDYNMYDDEDTNWTSDKKDEPTSEPSQPKQQRKGNPQVNIAAKKAAEEAGITPQKLGGEYPDTMLKAAVEALTDSNYHDEARELIAKLEGKPEWAKKPEYPSMDDPQYNEKMKALKATGVDSSEYWDYDDNTGRFARKVSSESSWDGGAAADGIAFTLRMNGFHKEADIIQSVLKESVTRLTTILKETTYSKKKSKSKSLINEASEPEIISQLKDIVKNKQYQDVKDPKTGKKMKVDMQSANAVLQIYDGLSNVNKDNMVKMGLPKMIEVSYKIIGKYK